MKIDEINFPFVVQSANSYADLCRHYKISNNGQNHRLFKELISKYNLSVAHWNWRNKLIKYPCIGKICPVCQGAFHTKLGDRDEKTVCSPKCSNIYFSNKRHTNESKKKTSESLKKYFLSIGKIPRIKIPGFRQPRLLYEKECKICNKKFHPRRETQQFCSNKCSMKFRVNDPIYIANLKAGVQKAIKEGRHKGWKTRNILSYPEKFFIRVLNNNTINFIPNKPFDGYFLDFAIDDKKIDLEIDGKQHKYQDRKASDIIRDKTLTDKGWKVYRIEWNSINTDDGKQIMKEKIDKFLEFYKTT